MRHLSSNHRPLLVLLFSLSSLLCLPQAAATDSTDAPWHNCGNSPEARELARLIMQDAAQQREAIYCHPILTHVAGDKAEVMASHQLVTHFLEGSPNSRLRDAGLHLPDYYGSAMSNQVEAIAGGFSDADEVWFAFKNSIDHRRHLLGEIDFYREQNQLGVGFYRDVTSPYVEHWVIYLTKLKKDSDHTNFETIPDKGLGIMTKPKLDINIKH